MHWGAEMSETSLLIKKIPPDLKDWLAAEASRNHRSMNKETIFLLQEARIQRNQVGKTQRDMNSIKDILQAMHALPVLDARPVNQALYGIDGLAR